MAQTNEVYDQHATAVYRVQEESEFVVHHKEVPISRAFYYTWAVFTALVTVVAIGFGALAADRADDTQRGYDTGMCIGSLMVSDPHGSTQETKLTICQRRHETTVPNP